MCNGDYVFCGTRSGDIVKLYVDLLAENGSKNASIVAAAVKKAPSRSGMNAGKFTGGIYLYLMIGIELIHSALKFAKKNFQSKRNWTKQRLKRGRTQTM